MALEGEHLERTLSDNPNSNKSVLDLIPREVKVEIANSKKKCWVCVYFQAIIVLGIGTFSSLFLYLNRNKLLKSQKVFLLFGAVYFNALGAYKMRETYNLYQESTMYH